MVCDPAHCWPLLRGRRLQAAVWCTVRQVLTGGCDGTSWVCVLRADDPEPTLRAKMWLHCEGRRPWDRESGDPFLQPHFSLPQLIMTRGPVLFSWHHLSHLSLHTPVPHLGSVHGDCVTRSPVLSHVDGTMSLGHGSQT